MTFDIAMELLLDGLRIRRKNQIDLGTWYELDDETLYLKSELYKVEEVFNGSDIVAKDWQLAPADAS